MTGVNINSLFLQYDDLDHLEFKGFVIGFYHEYSQVVGATGVFKSFTPEVIEWMHALVTVGKYIFTSSLSPLIIVFSLVITCS